MIEQIQIQRKLSETLEQIRNRNPSYSARSFARHLGLSSGALTSILKGRRRISRQLAEKILTKIEQDPNERGKLLSLFPRSEKIRKPALQSPLYRVIESESFRLMSEWQHFAILSLIKVRGFQGDPAWIARRLGIDATSASESVERLIKLGFLERSIDGRLRRPEQPLQTLDEIPQEALKKSHQGNLRLAAEALGKYDLHQRDFTAMTMAIDPDRITEAKQLIRDFQDQLANMLESGDSTEVYKICVQLFPLTVPDPGN